MKLVFPVGLREYESGVFIAQTIASPELSAAGASANDALRELREALTDVLKRMHPRDLWKIEQSNPPKARRVELPVYKTAAYDWYQSAASRLETKTIDWEVDVVTHQSDSGMIEIGLPLFSLSTYVHPDMPIKSGKDDEEEAKEPKTPEQVALEDLARVVRSAHTSLHFHRPRPTEFSVISLEIEFEPIDLREVPVDSLWLNIFPDEVVDPDAEEGPSTPTLDEIAQNWTEATEEDTDLRGFQEAYDRGTTLEELRGLAYGTMPSAVVLVGPPRVGKTSLVKHLVWEQQQSDEKPKRRIWFADPPRLVSTDPMSSGWQQQCRDVTAELEDTGDVLYMGRVVESLDAGKYVGSDYNLAQFFKPTLTDRRIRVIAEATVDEWADVERRDIGFARCFTVIRVDDPAPEIGERTVVRACTRISKLNNIEIPEAAIKRAWSLQRRFATEGSPVGRTIDFVGRTVRQALNRYQKSLDESALVEAFCYDTGLPPILLKDTMRLDLEAVRGRLKQRVMGQDHAVQRVADIIGITKAGLASDERPLGSFLFVGPTGVGKTELARALAEFLFGTQRRLVRIDMSEYSHGDAYNRLIGEGREDGDLTGPIRRQPFSVVLLDELEKAHPSVFDLLLQVLGEARLTDVNGRTTRFQNTIIVMTSNLGVDTLRPAIGFDSDEDLAESYAAHFKREAERFFRPEFLARIDQFIPFSPLKLEVVEEIARREVEKIQRRDGLKSQDVELRIDPQIPSLLAKLGFDEKYGARPLKRVIEQELVWNLAETLSRSREETSEGTTRLVTATPVKGAIEFSIEYVSGDKTTASARQQLLRQIDEISALRRRLQRYTYTNVFSDLEWEVDNFVISSQSSTFWEDPNAASMATRAQHARRVIDPVNDVGAELAALEDLANEAFHARTFAISSDLTDRLAELQEKVSEITMTVLRAAYDDPDHAALFLISRSHEDKWRDRLVEWYIQLAKAKDWDYELFRPIPDSDHIVKPDAHYDVDRLFWEETEETTAMVIGIEFYGYAARPLLRAEDGIHRFVAQDGNSSVEVWELDEYDEWPFPETVESGRTYAEVTRTYNYRTNEILMPEHEPLKLVPANPWTTLEPVLEDLVWDITETEWD